MKILAIVENFDDSYGGPSNSISGLLGSLHHKYGVTSKVISVNYKVGEKNSSIPPGVEWDNSCRLVGPKIFNYAPGLLKKIMSEIDLGTVVYINNLWNYVTIAAFVSAKIKRAKIVIAPRGSLFDWSLGQKKFIKKIAWMLFQKKIIAHADIIHATSDEEMNALSGLGFKESLRLIPHGVTPLVSCAKDKDFLIEKHGLDKGCRYVLFFSRLHKKKGLDVLLENWSVLCKEHPDWRLLICGPDYGGYRKKILSSSLSGIKYLGPIYGDARAELFEISDLYVLPSFSENFGVVIAEALSIGLPVVTTTNTPWEVVNEVGCGACVDISNFGSCLDQFLKIPPDELEVMGKVGKALIAEKYAWDVRANEFYLALKEVA